jgi:glutathione peroxidase-family protein
MPLDELLHTVARLGIEMLEFPCGNWSSAPHLNADMLLDNQAARCDFAAKLCDHGLGLRA